MGHLAFALDTQVFIKINNIYGNLKDQMNLDLCIIFIITVDREISAVKNIFVGVPE